MAVIWTTGSEQKRNYAAARHRNFPNYEDAEHTEKRKTPSAQVFSAKLNTAPGSTADGGTMLRLFIKNLNSKLAFFVSSVAPW
jgi:hypothetical protein